MSTSPLTLEGVPGTIDLMRLPLRGIVAYAARCARRALPYFSPLDDGGDGQESLYEADQAVRLAEDFARGRNAHDRYLRMKCDFSKMWIVTARSLDVDRPTAESADCLIHVLDATRTAAEFAERLRELIKVERDQPTPLFSADRLESSRRTLVASAERVADFAQRCAYHVAELDRRFVPRLVDDLFGLESLSLGHFPDLGATIDPTDEGCLGTLE